MFRYLISLHLLILSANCFELQTSLTKDSTAPTSLQTIPVRDSSSQASSLREPIGSSNSQANPHSNRLIYDQNGYPLTQGTWTSFGGEGIGLYAEIESAWNFSSQSQFKAWMPGFGFGVLLPHGISVGGAFSMSPFEQAYLVQTAPLQFAQFQDYLYRWEFRPGICFQPKWSDFDLGLHALWGIIEESQQGTSITQSHGSLGFELQVSRFGFSFFYAQRWYTQISKIGTNPSIGISFPIGFREEPLHE